jgi:AraC-like DNA-binding protein
MLAYADGSTHVGLRRREGRGVFKGNSPAPAVALSIAPPLCYICLIKERQIQTGRRAMPQLSLRTYGTGIACHSHDFNQIVLPRQGRLAMDIAGQGGAVTGGHAAFITAGTAHEYQAGAGDQFFVLDLLDDEGVADDDAAIDLAGTSFFALTPAQRDLLSYLDRLAPQVVAPQERAPQMPAPHVPTGATLGDWSPARWQRLGVSWGLLMLEAMPGRQIETSTPRVMPPALRRAIDLMQGGYAGKLTIAAIGRAAGLSETRLFLLFRQHLGCTPHAYLADLRLTAAEQLLASTDLPIVEIALRCGQGDQAALTRQMRRRRGITPAAYRHANR